MKHIIIPCLFLCLIFSQAFAQDDLIRNHSALQFYFVNGYAVSYKFPTKGTLNYRINLDFGANYSYSTGETTQENYIRTGSDNTKSISVTLTPQAYLYILTTEYASIYAGGGVFINYSYSKQNNNDNRRDYTDSSYFINNYKNSSYSFGLSALLGIEVKLTKNVTAFAESQLNGGRSWYSWKNDYVSDDNSPGWSSTSQHGWFVDYSAIRIGLGIYF
ncbi:MAG: hypothetical protein Q8903_08455 [Bacteroidota bacterium]|nr:hypothetical protein [Bacteroidota bacterium]